MAKLGTGSTTSPGTACAAMRKKHVLGQKGTPFSNCVSGGAKLLKNQHKEPIGAPGSGEADAAVRSCNRRTSERAAAVTSSTRRRAFRPALDDGAQRLDAGGIELPPGLRGDLLER